MAELDLIQTFEETLKGDRFEAYKLSFLILKPNAAKHYKAIMDEVEAQQFSVVGQYAIMDYETVNMALHNEQPDAIKYIIPISRMYYDFYGNYGVLLLIAKKDISYQNFCIQVVRVKQYLRSKFELSYISYAFDTSKLGMDNENQRLLIMAKDGKTEIPKDAMNQEGTFMVFIMNEIHSPDGDVTSTVKELKILKSMGLLDEANSIPKPLIKSMMRYRTFEYLKDML